jgi:hypothetical protein
LEGFTGEIDVLHVDFGRHYQRIAYKLSLYDIALYIDRSHDFEFIINKDYLLETDYTADLSPAAPDYINYYIVVIQPQA